MNNKLSEIFQFLIENRKFNQSIQIGSYRDALTPFNTTFDKVYSLLYNILNSQSQLKMDKSLIFFKEIYNNPKSLESFDNFVKHISKSQPQSISFKTLFNQLSEQNSWGKKTASLFTKAVYNCHFGYAKQFSFWKDVPELTTNDELYLPVDAVILKLFNELKVPCTNNFDGINNFIKKELGKDNFDIWDDLWFWGFITQNVIKDEHNKSKRGVCEFNEAKYWNLKNSIKDTALINELRTKSKTFYELVYNQ